MKLGIIIFSVLFSFSSFAQKNPALKFGDPLPANAFVELAKLINPAVVNISTTMIPKQRRGGPGYGRDPFFDMLEQFYGMQMRPAQPREQHALGTGFVIREDGLIVTNNHVIAGADVIQVQFSENDKKLHEAILVGSDERTDIALIKIKPSGKLPIAALGSSKDVEVGEWVAAFGNPFGQGHTMTKGIISAKGRDINELNRIPLLQTDTPINPGNSGGPLVNLKGQVIGVNSAIDARAQGIGFAIPIDELKAIIPLLEKNGKIKKAYLGVGLQQLNPMAAVQLGLKEDTEGVIIAGVEKGSPAQKGGLRTYDVITEFNGKKITHPGELSNAVADAPVGSNVAVKIMREGKEKTLQMSMGEKAEPQAKKIKTPQKSHSQKTVLDLGFSLADMNDDIRKDFNIPGEVGNKPVILEVEANGPAARAGLEAGDVILDINRKEVANVVDVNKLLKKGTNTLRVVRENVILIVMLETR